MKLYFWKTITFITLCATFGCGNDSDTNNSTNNATVTNNAIVTNNHTDGTNNATTTNNVVTNNHTDGTNNATTINTTEGLQFRIEVGEELTFEIPTHPDATYDFNVDCNSDGINEAEGVSEYECVYETEGTHRVTITGVFSRIYFVDAFPNVNARALVAVEDWGDIRWTTMSQAFAGCLNLVSLPPTGPDLTNVTDLSRMFYASRFNGPIDSWDVSSITTMEGMFSQNDKFNQALESWDVSSVLTMKKMFFGAEEFNQKIDSWDVSSVTSMYEMFGDTKAFNQTLDSWNVESVTDMAHMFDGAEFNQPINSWNVESVTDMSAMFNRTTQFDQPLNSWDVSSVTDMTRVFYEAESFNQPLDSWDVSSVIVMTEMFLRATKFNQPLGSWNVSSVNSALFMLIDTSLSTENYDNLLLGWSTRSLRSTIPFGVGTTKHSSAATQAKAILENDFNWIITDGGEL